MTALVLDASAFVHAFTESTSGAAALRRRIVAERVHAPHLMEAEVGSVIRRLTISGRMKAARGLVIVEGATSGVTHRYAHGPRARLAWSLRADVSYYDGLYVALATTLSVPLLTADARLARAPGLPCDVEVIS